MRIHHLNCASLCPVGRRLVNGQGNWFAPAHICCHCLLIESDEGLVLVDSGLSTRDLDPRHSRIPLPLRGVLRPEMDPAQTALRQVEALGYKAADVRHVVLTHLDFDHAGGIVDFPEARVHAFTDELQAALAPRTLHERSRYVRDYWAHGPQWERHGLGGETWQGFSSVRALSSRETEVLLVPVIGHTRGHCAVAVRDGDDWLVHAGDAYFHHGEMEMPPHCPPALAAFQRLVAHDNASRLRNQERLRELALHNDGNVHLFSAHDPVELSRMQQRR